MKAIMTITDMKKLIVLTAVVLLGWGSFNTASAQQMSLQSQFLMNEYQVNPAIAGNSGFTKINFTAREQWLGLARSPKTHSASFQTRLLNSSYIIKKNPIRKKSLKPSKMGRIGLGAIVYDDRNGDVSRSGVQFTYAYHIPLKESQLSFGVSLEAFQWMLRKEDITMADQGDSDWQAYDPSKFIPDANFGVYYMARDYTLGYSTYHMFQSALKAAEETESDYQMKRHHFITGGYTYDINSDFYLKGYLLLRTTNHFRSFQTDASLTAFFHNQYWAGLSYRTANTIIIKAGLKIENFNFGYAFDYSINQLNKYTYGSHELTATLRFGGNARRYRWLNHNLY